MDYQSYTRTFQYFSSSDGQIAYRDLGQGPAILLLHGVPTSSWLYRHMQQLLADQGYRIIAPDMLGYGASEKPAGYDIYSAFNTAKRILELMQHLQIDSWTQVFHDGGGLWTWELLKMQPAKISHLIMLNSIVYQSGFKPPIKFKPGWISRLFTRLYCSPLGQWMTINGTFRNGIKNKSVINSKMLEGYKKPLINGGHRGLYYFFTQTCQQIEDYTNLHQSINTPVHVIWGQLDDMLQWEPIADQVKANFRNLHSPIHLLEAKHFIQEELPELITEKIIQAITVK